MNSIPNLSFFKVIKYSQPDGFICDYRNVPRPHYCMGLILKGCGSFEFSKKTVTVETGDIIFVPIGSTYASMWSGFEGAVYISAHFSFEYNSFLSRNSKMEIQKIKLFDYPDIKSKFEKMYKSYNEDQFASLSTFYDIISMIYPELVYTKSNVLDERIEKSVNYIEQHYTEDFSVDYLAKLCNMSASYFYSRFKNYIGLTPIQYKHKLCIDKACLMLIDDRKISIEEISNALGFVSSIYFRRKFKEITGQTPTNYRKSKLEL